MDAFTTEQSLRQEAIRRRLEGEQRCAICAALGKSLGWFSLWWRRYCQDPQTDFQDHSRAPHTSPTRLPEGIAHAIVQIRRTFEQAQCGLIGAAAIRRELVRQHIKPCPSLSTIQRMLKARHRTQPQGGGAPQAYYPELLATGPNDLHATDIITRHLWGGLVIQHFHTIDHYSHAVHLSQHLDKTSATARTHLLETWADLGLPTVQQLDNEDAFSGGHTHPRVFGQIVRLCLFVGVEVLFTPEYEAKRNYRIEGFHSLWVKAFWRRNRFRSLAHVVRKTPTFLRWYHQQYRPPSLDGHSPAQRRRGFRPERVTAFRRHEIPVRLPITAGRIHLMRRVKQDGTIRLLNETWRVGLKWCGQYVLATIDTASETLTIWHKANSTTPWKRIKTWRYPLAEPVQPLRPCFRRKRSRCLDYWPD